MQRTACSRAELSLQAGNRSEVLFSSLSISSKRARGSIHLRFVGQKGGVHSLFICGVW